MTLETLSLASVIPCVTFYTNLQRLLKIVNFAKANEILLGVDLYESIARRIEVLELPFVAFE